MSEKKPRFKLCPELSDGTTSMIVDDPEAVTELVQAWCEEMMLGDRDGAGIDIEVVSMTDKEVEELPEM